MFSTRPRIFFFFAFFLALLSGCAPKSLVKNPDLIEPISGMEFVFVKGGSFKMGSTAHKSEQPVHEVNVGDMYVGMYEVTFTQYQEYCDTTPKCELPSDNEWGKLNRPIIYVSWDDANAYATWLSNESGLEFRLPTEAEWEYFARAGTTNAYWTGKKIPKGWANCADCGSEWDGKSTAPVGSFPPNPWGIYNTIGNVVEWVADDYAEDYSNTPSDGSPFISENTSKKVQRGGAWDYSAQDSRSSYRDYRSAKSRNANAGFRLVLVPQPSAPLSSK